MTAVRRHRFLLLRRSSQLAIIILLVGANLFGWQVLTGNLSGSRVFSVLPLSDPYAVLQIFATGHGVSADAFAGALGALLFFGLAAGRSFCGWVCPMNLVTDLAAWLRRLAVVEGGQMLSRNARYWILVLSLVVSSLSGVAAFEAISPVSILHRGIIFGMGAGWAIVLGVFFFDLLVQARGFCGHLCPLGAFYSAVSRFSFLRVLHDLHSCTRCGRCVEVCPEPQVLSLVGRSEGPVTSGECTNCGRCVDVCEDGAMHFGSRFRPERSTTVTAE